MKNILLTGANGFIGSYFKNKCSTKYNISTFSFLNNDLSTLKLSNRDTVVHLSALVHQMGGASESEYEKVNVDQTIILAKIAKERDVKHFIFMSTVKVYGEETNIAYNEHSNCKPIDDYGKSKLKAELELQKLEDDHFKVSIIRTPIVYGYGVKANMKSLINLVNKVSVLPFGQIENRRNFVYIGNLIGLIDAVIEKEKSGIFLASDDMPISTTRLIHSISKELDKKRYLIKIPFFEILLKILKPGLHKRLYQNLEIDNTSTKISLGFKNKYTVDEGIKYMIRGET
jgi:UDP-glucose 4-epimerase